MRRARPAAAAVVLILFGALLATAPVAAQGAPDTPAPSLAWGPCQDEVLASVPTLECATLAVPVDIRAPGGPQIDLALVRIPALDQARRLGTLVVNPGGPGGSGIFLAMGLAGERSPPALRNFYDIVGFDPRFVGASEGLDCPKVTSTVTAEPGSAAWVEALRADSAQLAAQCRAEAGALLEFVGTTSVVADLERIRIALGEERLDFLGFSYGTRIGTVYAQTYPDRVGRMVLDGALAPTMTSFDYVLDGAMAAESMFGRWADWCAVRAECPIGPDPTAAWVELRDSLQSDPVRLQMSDDSTWTITASDLVVATLTLLDGASSWPRLAELVAGALEGDVDDLVELGAYARGSSLGGDGIYQAVMCADEGIRLTGAQVQGLIAQAREVAPLVGFASEGANIAITFSTCPNAPTPVPPLSVGPAQGLPPVLVVGNTGDPATAYPWTQRLAGALAGSGLVTWDAPQHTAYLSNLCVGRYVDWFWLTGQVPIDGPTCAFVPPEFEPAEDAEPPEALAA